MRFFSRNIMKSYKREIWQYFLTIPWLVVLMLFLFIYLPSFSFSEDQAVTGESWKKSVSTAQMDLYLKGAQLEVEKGHTYVERLLSVLKNTHSISSVEQSEFTLMLFSHAKASKVPILQALQPVFQSLPTSWVIDLSGGQTSLVLEIMTLQTCQKPVELRGQTEEENECRNVLLCLPFISQLRWVLTVCAYICCDIQCVYLMWPKNVNRIKHCVH